MKIHFLRLFYLFLFSIAINIFVIPIMLILAFIAIIKRDFNSSEFHYIRFSDMLENYKKYRERK